MAMNVEKKGKQLIITIDLQDPKPSASGKTMIVATSGGNKTTDLQINGHNVTVGVNAFIKA